MKKKLSNKKLALLISLLLVLTVSVGGTLAYIVTQTGVLTNTFTPAEVTCRVDESFDGVTKSNVKISNTGDTAAYIRAAIIVTWQNKDGNVAADPVPSSAYTMTLNTADQLAANVWTEGSDGYYYYSSPVAVDGSTEALISSCSLKEGVTPPEGYYLCVEIVADAVQAEPAQAVIDSWGANVTDGKISK